MIPIAITHDEIMTYLQTETQRLITHTAFTRSPRRDKYKFLIFRQDSYN
jgi:hypothetical protein